MEYVAVPMDFPKQNKFVTLIVDVMFMRNMPCFIDMSHSIKFLTVEHMPTCTASKLSKPLKISMKI